jgi:hypothetical protein
MRRERTATPSSPPPTGVSRLFLHLLDAGVLVGANGLGCLATPMGERDEIAEATARALHVLARED